MRLHNFLRLTSLLLISIFLLNSCNREINSTAFIEKELFELLKQKEYFKLEEQLNINKGRINEFKLLYLQAFVSKAFGLRQKSNDYINLIFENHKTDCNDSVRITLLDLKASNYIYNYEYNKAADVYDTILSSYLNILDSIDIATYQNTQNLFNSIRTIKPQVMRKPVDFVKLNSFRNKFNHLLVPVTSKEVKENFIFDTGANLSTISESQAKKMKLKIFDQAVDIASSTKINVQSKLGVADSFYIGDILFENVVFLIMPDEALDFPELNYRINGIIGFPVIRQMNEIRLNKDGIIEVFESNGINKDRNMFLEGLNPVVQVFSDSDTLFFTFDTGAKNSELSYKYFINNKERVKKNGLLQTNKRGGAGGQANVKEYELKDFSLRIGNSNTKLKNISVTLEEYEFNRYFDGNLGQDVITQFNALVINFKNMYVDLE